MRKQQQQQERQSWLEELAGKGGQQAQKPSLLHFCFQTQDTEKHIYNNQCKLLQIISQGREKKNAGKSF